MPAAKHKSRKLQTMVPTLDMITEYLVRVSTNLFTQYSLSEHTEYSSIANAIG